jgi:hypothetical protein
MAVPSNSCTVAPGGSESKLMVKALTGLGFGAAPEVGGDGFGLGEEDGVPEVGVAEDAGAAPDVGATPDVGTGSALLPGLGGSSAVK